MRNTPIYGIPVPETSDPPNGPDQMWGLAKKVEDSIGSFMQPIGCEVGLAADVGVSAAGAFIPWSKALDDQTGLWDQAGDRTKLIVKEGGRYSVSAQAWVLPGGGTASYALWLTLNSPADPSNSVIASFIAENPPGWNPFVLPLQKSVRLKKGDYIQAYVVVWAGSGAMTLFSSGTKLSLDRYPSDPTIEPSPDRTYSLPPNSPTPK